MSEGKFMVAVGAVIENQISGKILLLQRTHRSDFLPGVWEVPSGRMKQFEELEEALGRELFEETGIQGFEIVKPLTVSHFYRGEKTAEQEIVLIVYWVRTETEAVTISAEHDDYQWASPENARAVVGHPEIARDIATFIHERSLEDHDAESHSFCSR